MRRLRYVLDLSDGIRREEAALPYSRAQGIVVDLDKAGSAPGRVSDSADYPPFALFLDEEESFFMVMPEAEGLQVTARVLDKWNLFGLLPQDKAFTLDFGILSGEDTLTLLRLFYENNYPALRSLEKCMRN